MAESAGVATGGRKDVIWQQSSVAANYLGASRQAIPLVNEQLDAMVRVLRAVHVPTSRVLDVGAGDGAVAEVVAREFPVDRITLVDFSPPMLEGASSRFAGWSGDLDVINSDLAAPQWQASLPRAAIPYNVIVSRYAIHHLPDSRKQSLYGELFELLAPGGMFVNIEHVESAASAYSSVFDDLMIEGIRATSSEADASAVAAAYHARQDRDTNILAPVETQCDWLRTTGFVDVDVVMKIFELAVIVARRPGSTDA